MIDSYWDLYVAYVNRCVADNRDNDIDPAHYKMEWNHFLPRCVFGDWPIGHYLTLKQHAIASALQTLALKRNCMCGWHKKYLPDFVLDEAWPYFRDFSRKNVAKVHSEKDGRGKSIVASKAGQASAERLRRIKEEGGDLWERLIAKSREMSIKMNETKHAERDPYGRSLAGKASNLAKKARPMKVTKLDTGETFEFANSIDAGLALGLIPRCLRKVASGERNSIYGYVAEFTDC